MSHPDDTSAHQSNNGGDDDDGSDCDLAFATLDLTGVDFDETTGQNSEVASDEDLLALEVEQWTVMGGDDKRQDPKKYLETLKEKASDMSSSSSMKQVLELADLISNGNYVAALQSPSAQRFLASHDDCEDTADFSLWSRIRSRLAEVDSLTNLVQVELIAIAALNLFLQLNYTGPAFDDPLMQLQGINPHACFAEYLQANEQDAEDKRQTITAQRDTKFHNKVLSELSVDGTWPCQVADGPYFLLVARCIFSNIVCSSEISGKDSWWGLEGSGTSCQTNLLSSLTAKLFAAPLWSARVAVAHERLLLTYEPSVKLWNEVETTFEHCISRIEQQGELDSDSTSQLRPTVSLEYGLACYHFEHNKKGKALFEQAMNQSGLEVEVTGSQGKRTKFQQKATAQMIVRASSRHAAHNSKNASESSMSAPDENETPVSLENNNSKQTSNDSSQVKSQQIKHSEDSILFENVKYEDEKDNEVSELTVLDQSILMALCLDVKNNNPADGLTAGEMGAYLARVLRHHDDWMVYSTALLERAWLEFEGNHTKERSILQMQALADQHTNRLTITQSTRKSIEETSPVQDRLRYIHCIVYPPRWHMLRDIAERYASLGVVTSAAEIFTEIELWDEVVDCYRRAGKASRAEEIVRERLEISETPRMWMALGDLTGDPTHYQKAIELSSGRFSQAYISLGKFCFDKGQLQEAACAYKQALQLRPLIPSVWFRVGTISMKLGDWDTALTAFSEVVQQQPDEGEAWANVAAVHMHNKHPQEAYPALVESLKHNRTNWRVWVSKLYTCLDLEKYDEAIQACNMIMDLKKTHSASAVPDLEDKCVRAIVGGSIEKYEAAKKDSSVAIDAERRSLNRVHALLQRINTVSNDPWVFETMAYFHERVGQDKQVFENLMKEYRALSAVRAWEKDDQQVYKVCHVVAQIVAYQRGNMEELVKSKFLVSTVMRKIQQARVDSGHIPEDLGMLEKLLHEITDEIDKANVTS
jgi:tetratricopeptide (TPR) repeat protein